MRSVVAVENGVDQAADGPHYGNGPVLERDHLGQTAGLEEAGHREHVRARVDQVCQTFVEADLEMAVGVVSEVMLELPEVPVDGRVSAAAEQDELSAAGESVEDGVADQMHAFLPVDAAYIGDDRFEVPAQPEA